jgi:hypothetical protein
MNEDFNFFAEETVEETNLYVEALEATADFAEDFSIMKDKMMIAEHTAVLTENAFLLQEAKGEFGANFKEFVGKVITKIKELFKKFINFMKEIGSKVKKALQSAKNNIKHAVTQGTKIYDMNDIKNIFTAVEQQLKFAESGVYSKSGNEGFKEGTKALRDAAREGMVKVKNEKDVYGLLNQNYSFASQLTSLEGKIVSKIKAVNPGDGEEVSNTNKALRSLVNMVGLGLELTKHNIKVLTKNK